MSHPQETLPLGATAPHFELPGVDGRTWRSDDAAGPNGLVVMFICNHCPYVKAVVDRIVADAQALKAIGVGVVAINSNDAASYPEDSFERMQDFARQHGFGFPYLHDESQAVARGFGAVCTPEFFGLDRDRVLRYRGRLDGSGNRAAPPGTPRELVDAMRRVADTGQGPERQVASIGCSIKWKRG